MVSNLSVSIRGIWHSIAEMYTVDRHAMMQNAQTLYLPLCSHYGSSCRLSPANDWLLATVSLGIFTLDGVLQSLDK